MARSTRAAELGLVAVSIEGGMIAPEQVQKIVAADRTAKTADSYGCPKGTGLGDEISRYFRIGQHIWKDYARIDAPTVTQTAQFARDLLTQCFGFTDLAGPVEHHGGTRRYRLAWEAKDGRVPVVVAAPVDGADAFNKAQPEFGDGEGGRPRRSPVSLLQEWLNATDHALWGLVFAGDRVRLMRDNASLTRPAWIEADLGAMFRDEMFADFTAWWLVAHATRFGAAGAPPSESPLEQWREEGMKQGIKARADLRRNVEEALSELGQGLVEANPELVERIRSGALPLQSLFGELLRTVYRLIFLAVAEDRDLLHPRRTPQAARILYADSYSFTFWRERSRRRVARDGHHDVWEAMKVTLSSLEHGQELLGLPALGGLFAKSETPSLNDALIPNRRFLSAIFCLGFIRKDGATHRINWRDLKTEELGSVYESLLEIRPRLEANGSFTLDSGAKGNDRKTSSSYYTPDPLVETLLDSALEPVLDKAETNAETPEAKVAAILDLKVIDPACGSGHFLLGAARRMADKVARLRNEDAGKEDTQAALRDVVSRCIHGVDRNPMAVELAKVALWIESVSPGQPLGFLDANIRCGDSLLGVFDLDALEEGIPDEAYKPLTGDDKDAAKYYLKLNRDAKKGQGRFDWSSGTGAMPPKKLAANLNSIRKMPEDTVGQVEKKRAAFDTWRHDPDRWSTRVACDLYVAAFLLPKTEVPLNDQRGLVPTTADVRKKLGGGQLYGPLEGAAAEAADAARLLHWPLTFPDVLIERGGFDVVLGNPPWDVVQLGEKEYFESRVPEIATLKGAARKKAISGLAQSHPEIFAEFAKDKRQFESANEFARAAGRFDLTARGKINTYALFAELFLNLTRKGGRSGLIVQSGITTDATTADFFSHLVESGQLISSLGFDNARRLFPSVHPDTPFVLLTMGTSTEAVNFTSYILAVDELEDKRRHYSLTSAEIARINPNTKTAPVFRSKRDAELTASIYNRVPVLYDEREKRWAIPTQLVQNFFSGSNAKDQLAFEAAASLPTDGSDPVYRGSMVWHFNHRVSTFDPEAGIFRSLNKNELAEPNFEVRSDKYVAKSELISRFEVRGWQKDWFCGWRDITNATNERTVVSAIVPYAAADDTFSVILPDDGALAAVMIVATLNTLVVDFCAQQKVGGTHIRKFTLQQFPILPPQAYSEADLAFIVPRVLELSYTSHSMAPFARDLGYEGEPFAWDEDRRAQLRAELDAWYALAYGLTRDELRYVLDPKDVMGADYPSETFRVLQNNERTKYGEYRTQRLVLAAYDELMAQGMRPRLEGYR
ncbi:DNA methyltransferase [Paracoccus litorisediminis]|uniref:Eco57I restriction-modification methylase domain-containing protein n=1 Tax=Paracoccus litorisediminis TaxID=2006130 RepID=UPI00372F2182